MMDTSTARARREATAPVRSIRRSRRPPVMRDPQPHRLLVSFRETPSVRAVHELVPVVAELVLLPHTTSPRLQICN